MLCGNIIIIVSTADISKKKWKYNEQNKGYFIDFITYYFIDFL